MKVGEHSTVKTKVMFLPKFLSGQLIRGASMIGSEVCITALAHTGHDCNLYN